MNYKEIINHIQKTSPDLFKHTCQGIKKDEVYQPNKNYVDEVLLPSNRNVKVLKSIQQIFSHGRLQHTGYVSILPVDQGIEHGAGSSFSANSMYFHPENIVKLAIEGSCNAVATTFGNFGLIARKYAHKIPFIVKLNHNELLTYPNEYKQIAFGSVKEAWNLGATAVGATIYFGSENTKKQIQEVGRWFEEAHELGMATILWCYTRNKAFKTKLIDYHTAADLTGQANHLGVTLQADFIKQKLPTLDKGFQDLHFGSSLTAMYKQLIGTHIIDACRYQVANGYMGRIGLINSGGPSLGEEDLIEAIKIAIINKRAGGMGLITGRKAFQKSVKEGIHLLNCIQDVYLDSHITLA